jgi:PAS domain S-box-containing protein
MKNFAEQKSKALKKAAGNVSDKTLSAIEDKNRENEDRLNAVFENPSLAVVILDLNGNYLKVNKTGLKMIGYSQKELLKMNVYDTSHPDDTGHSEYALNKMMTHNKKMVTYEKRLRRKDGQSIWARITLSAIEGNSGNPEYIVAFAEDITSQRSIREELAESEERYRTLVTSMPGVVFNCTQEAGREMFYISKQIKDLSGYDAAEFLTGKKRKFASVLHPADIERIKVEVPTLGEEPSPYSMEYRIIHKDKSIRWVHEAGQAYFDKKLKSYCLTGVMIDITSRVAAEEGQKMLMQNLQRAYREVNEFAHIVSHDLKAPLRGISSLSTWLFEDYHDKLDEDGRKNLLLLQDRVEKMDGLIDGILAYSAVTKGTKQIEDVDLNKVLDAIREMLEVPNGFKIIVKKKLPVVRANNYHMYQLFQNIISNAIKYNDKPEGRVIINYKHADGKYFFTIKDNGIGIPKEYQHKIFDIFQTLHTKDRKSSGVGLSIVKKIVELYHGEISVESEPGQGVALYFSIQKHADLQNSMINERK